MSKKAEGFSLRFVLINTGNISRKVLSKVLRSFVKNFERLQTEQENCIIIGRCANYIYRDRKDCVSVYLHADRAVRCERIQKRDQISEREALKMIQEVDEKRAAFQEQCTSTKWGDGNEYDLCINTGIIGIEYAVEMILEYIRFENIL